MDPDISQWIAEYLLRQQQQLTPPLLDSVLSLLPLTTTPISPRLQKTLLLTSLTHDVITEKTLTTLETLEQLAFEEGKAASERMRRAYVNVALECTARWVGEGGERKEGFLEVVERVWRKRVGKVEDGLGCEEGRMWNDVVEAAVWDDGAVESLVTWRRESGVGGVVREYVDEAWEEMGPAFLEVVAEKGGELVERIRGGVGEGGGGGGGGERVEEEKGGVVNTCREMVKVDGMIMILSFTP